MEHQKILNLLNQANDSKFVTRAWNNINYESYGENGERHEIICKKEVLKSNFCDYNGAYILVLGNIIVIEAPETKVSFKNCALFIKCITKIIKKHSCSDQFKSS